MKKVNYKKVINKNIFKGDEDLFRLFKAFLRMIGYVCLLFFIVIWKLAKNASKK